jgi:protein SCO1/2
MNMNLSKPWSPIFRFFMLLLAGLALTACSPKQSFKNVDITGSKAFGTEFSLLDPDGKVRTLSDFKGKAVVMFFGYTQCPDVCPTTLTEMQQVMTLLGPQADKVQVLFVTVDPERDSADILKQYVPAFDSRFLGLRPADEAALEKVTKDFKIYYKKVPGTSPGSYTMDHTAGSYAFDPAGQLRLYIKHAQGPETLAQDLKELLK